MPVLSGAAPFYMNWLKEGQKYDVQVFLSTEHQSTFFQYSSRGRKPSVETTTPVWTLSEMVYSLDDEHTNTQSFELDLDLDLLQRAVI